MHDDAEIALGVVVFRVDQADPQQIVGRRSVDNRASKNAPPAPKSPILKDLDAGCFRRSGSITERVPCRREVTG